MSPFTISQRNEYIGERYGRLTIVSFAELDNNGKTKWHCKCDCGHKIIARISDLRKGDTKSCGCLYKEMIDAHSLTGTRMGKLMIGTSAMYKQPSGHPRRKYLCKCDCGNEIWVRIDTLQYGKKMDCGCARYAFTGSGFNKALAHEALQSYKSDAVARMLDWELTPDEFTDLIFSPCYYCGVESSIFIDRTNNGIRTKSRTLVRNGIDRINSDIGYKLSNCVPCCKLCNRVKSNMNIADFLQWSQRLSSNLLRERIYEQHAISTVLLTDFKEKRKVNNMGYMHIDNLYRSQDILMFKRCYAMEKVHGTSASVLYNADNTPSLTFFSGGENHQRFVSLFNQEELTSKLKNLGHVKVKVYGEAYGGRQQGMRLTYGEQLRFIAFDVKIGDSWLSVKDAEGVVLSLGLEFVPYEEISTDLAELDRVRDLPSEVAKRRGCGDDKKREGVVLRPLIELTKNNGDRIIVKHKQESFSERSTPQKVVDPATLAVLSEAKAISQEWCTPMRLSHVLDKIKVYDIKDTKTVINAMIEDVYREAKGEIIESKEAKAEIGRRAAQLFKEFINQKFREKRPAEDDILVHPRGMGALPPNHSEDM